MRALLILIAAAPAMAQCVMCARNAAAQSAQQASALNAGIFALAIPAVGSLGALVFYIWRRR